MYMSALTTKKLPAQHVSSAEDEMRKSALVELTNRGLMAGGGQGGSRVKGDTKLSWFLSVGLRALYL